MLTGQIGFHILLRLSFTCIYSQSDACSCRTLGFIGLTFPGGTRSGNAPASCSSCFSGWFSAGGCSSFRGLVVG